MAVQVELWKPEIIEFLEKDNEFMKSCVVADEYVLQGKVVHIPQAGAPSGVQRNRATLPGVVLQRGDTDVTYVIDDYTTDPVLIPNKDTAELSYDKRQSVLSQDMLILKETAANNLLHLWGKDLTTAQQILTTGAASTATGSGMTGNRKKLTEDDVRAAMTKLNRDSVPQAGRFMIITADQMSELLENVNTKAAFFNHPNLKEGVVGRLYGFDFYVRSTVLRFATGGTIKLPEAADATTDNAAALFYQKGVVERAFGDISMFEAKGDPQYYGDLYSFLVRLGGRARRGDLKGLGFVLQAP